jgi:nicotinamide mononucleotide transporter
MTLAELGASLRGLAGLETAAVVLAIAYLVLAIRQNILCWVAGFLSSLIYLGVFFGARLYMESALQVFYAAMAIYGFVQWRYGGEDRAGVRITTWSLRQHALTLGLIAVLTLSFGAFLSNTNAAFPFLDSLTSVAAVATTYMVARKILENWVYWFVIDSLSVYLYLARGLELTAALFMLYLVLIVIGFWQWRKEWQAQ